MQLPAELLAIDWYIDGTRSNNWDNVSATWLTGSDLEDEQQHRQAFNSKGDRCVSTTLFIR